MPNKNYIAGVRKERKLVNEARAQGFISFRSAGSHSPIDVVIIDKKNMKVRFIQCKPESMSQNARSKIIESQFDLQGRFLVSFEVL